MASIRQRSGTWQARVRRKGFPDEVKTFPSKAEASAWACSIEAAMYQGSYRASAKVGDLSFGDLLLRYVAEVSPTKRSFKREAECIQFIRRQRIAAYSTANITPAVLGAYRDERMKTISAGTMIRELSIISSVISHARKEWGLPIENPCALVRKPQAPRGRERVLSSEEEVALLSELKPTGRRSAWMAPLVSLALETAMRRGELLALEWSQIDLAKQIACLPMTKNGLARTVPLSKAAVAILAALPKHSSGRVFPLSYMVVNNCFVAACRRAEINNLRFHDLRHTATTRLAERLPNVIELAAVTGHQTIQMLKRYYHPQAHLLAQKLG